MRYGMRSLICLVLVGAFVTGVFISPRALAQDVTTDPPAKTAPASSEPCPKGKRGGAIGGIVVGSVFWWVLPMSIPVLITQSKKLKAHNKAQMERRCQYAPR